MGYRLVGGYRTRLTGLARGEAEALFLSGVPGALREMGLEDAASAARLKVSAALLPSLRNAPRTAAQRFHLDAPGWFREPGTPGLLPAVRRPSGPTAASPPAISGARTVGVASRVGMARTVGVARTAGGGRGGPDSRGGPDGPDRKDRQEVNRTLEPYGLVLKAGVWYLCARAVAGQDAQRGTGPNPAAAPDPAAGTDPGAGPDPGAGQGRIAAPTPGARPAPNGAAAPGAAQDRPGTATPVPPRPPRRPPLVRRLPRLPRRPLHRGRAGRGGRLFVRDEAFDLPAFWAERATPFARSILRARWNCGSRWRAPAGCRGVTDPVGAREALGRRRRPRR